VEKNDFTNIDTTDMIL